MTESKLNWGLSYNKYSKTLDHYKFRPCIQCTTINQKCRLKQCPHDDKLYEA